MLRRFVACEDIPQHVEDDDSCAALAFYIMKNGEPAIAKLFLSRYTIPQYNQYKIGSLFSRDRKSVV